MSAEQEDIFHIADHTHLTDFESLASSVELYLRHSGFSSDLRTASQSAVSKHFRLGESRFSCYHTPNKRRKMLEERSEEPLCIREMREGSVYSYPSGEHALTILFGVSEFLVIHGSKISESDETTILSAFAVGAQNAKCALPFFLTRSQSRGIAQMIIEGLMCFPGYLASFEAWELCKGRKDSDPNPLKQSLEFFQTRVEPSASNLKASVSVAYQRVRPQHQSVDVITRVIVWTCWNIRPVEEMLAIARDTEFDLQQSNGFRVCLRVDETAAATSECLLQLTKWEAREEEATNSPAHAELGDVDNFDDLLLNLEGIFPLFPLNGFWTRKMITLMEESNFTASAFSASIPSIRSSALRAETPAVAEDDFKDFSRFSELHQHFLVVCGAVQSLRKIRQSCADDPCSRLLFLHNSPAHFPEQQLQAPDTVPAYQENLITRILRAYLLDMYTKEGCQPSIPQLIEWHRDTLTTFPFYKEIYGGRDDRSVLTLWQLASSRSFSETTAFIENELTKEMEMSLQMLESLSPEETSKQLIGLGVSAVLAVAFRNQLALLDKSQTGPTVLAEVKQLIRPSFEEFRKSSKQLLSALQPSSPELITALQKSLRELELSLSKAFSLTVKFSESRGLTAKLMKNCELDITDPADRTEVIELVTCLRPSGVWQTHTVILSNLTRFGCIYESDRTKMAIGRISKELTHE